MASPNVDLLNASPADLCAFLKANGIQRFSLVSETAAAAGDYKVRASHPKLDSLARWMETSPDMHGHEGVFVWVSPKTGVLQSAAVHRTCRGQVSSPAIVVLIFANRFLFEFKEFIFIESETKPIFYSV